MDESLKELMYNFQSSGRNHQEISVFQHENRKKQWLAVRLLLDEISLEKTKILYHENGQPYTEKYNLSISHSHELVAVCMSLNKAVGIDIQKKDEKIFRIAKRFLTEEEQLLCAGDLENTTKCWAVKEALYKLYGDGSPYFDKDYQVLNITPDYVKAKMCYKNIWQEFHLQIEKMEDAVIAVVSD